MSLFGNIVKAIVGNDEGKSRTIGFVRDPARLVALSFDPIKTISTDLAAKAVEFVLNGTNESVLLEFAAVQAEFPGKRLGSPGRLARAFYAYETDEIQKQGKASLGARSQLYTVLGQDTAALNLLVRLGKVLAAADAGDSLESTGAAVPDWLHYLVNDAIFASFDTYSVESKEIHKHRPDWTIQRIVQLLEIDSHDPALALQLAFERKGLGYYVSHNLDIFLDSVLTGQLMSAQPSVTAQLPKTLSVSGKLVLIKFIAETAELKQQFGNLLVGLSVDTSKQVRAEAASHVESMPVEVRLPLFKQALLQGSTTERVHAIEILSRLPDEGSRQLIEAALTTETTKSVIEALRAAESRRNAAQDANNLELPPAVSWSPFPDDQLGPAAFEQLNKNRLQIIENARLAAEAEAVENKTASYKSKWRATQYKDAKEVTERHLESLIRVLNGQGIKDDVKTSSTYRVTESLSYKDSMQSIPNFGISHLIRFLNLNNADSGFWNQQAFQQWFASQDTDSFDLRAVAQLLERSNLSIDSVANACLARSWYSEIATDVLPAERVWPFFAEHPYYIDRALGLSGSTAQNGSNQYLDLSATLKTISTFPVIPSRWIPRIMELALGEGKTYRYEAQQTLSELPNIGDRVTEFLGNSKSEIRIEAAYWLVSLDHRPALALLTKALNKESRETVRAAFLNALEQLGGDIGEWLKPDALLAEARKGLKAKLPSGLSWFSKSMLPECQWLNRDSVDSDIVFWWVVLACKLKEPGGNALLTRYLGLLSEASRTQVSKHIFLQFIAQDTRGPSLEEGVAYAKQIAPGRWQSIQDSVKQATGDWKAFWEREAKKTQEQIFEELKREKMSEYLGSAIGEKGLLALIAFAPAHLLVSELKLYMRDHYQRRAQLEAMLEGSAATNDPLVIQLLLSISRRYRTASVQEKARALIQDIADRNAWSKDQLADRTIPTAGFDESGVLQLPMGDREFTMVLDAAMKPELRSPDGKVVKALPEARQNDDPAQIKETKVLFSSSKKELKQIIELQTNRLYEAMCSTRVWPAAEWQEYLFSHPIAGRLIQRLIWEQLDSLGQSRGCFRTTDDGSLINTDDDEVELDPAGQVRLAHAALMDDTTIKTWLKHFADYKVSPLFAQLTRKLPTLSLVDQTGRSLTKISDREGWLSDAFTLRGAFNKLNYQRSASVESGFFSHYFKEFESLNIRALIEFSGNTLPEENVTAALYSLQFESMKGSQWNQRTLNLDTIPTILLAETYADYHTIAKACLGFDADWPKKVPW